MCHILPLLTEMRGRLGMFIGVPSITRLAAFLRGYDLAMQKSGRASDPFLVNFRDWIHVRLQTNSLSWEDAILEKSAGEADAVNRFWAFLDEYLLDAENEQHAQAKKNGGLVAQNVPSTIHSK